MRHAEVDLRRVVLEDLLRTGAPVCMTVLVARLSRSRSDVLRALRALEADGRVTITVLPKVRSCTSREREYRAVPGATLDGLEPASQSDSTPVPLKHQAPLKHQDRIENRLICGPVTCQQVAKGVQVSEQHARRVLNHLVEQGLATRTLGPRPRLGSTRPYVYSWVRQ